MKKLFKAESKKHFLIKLTT